MNRPNALLAPLLAVVAMLLGLGGTASAAFNPAATEAPLGNFLLWEYEASLSIPLELADPSREIGVWVYDDALGVPVYVRQNPWTFFDPYGLELEWVQGHGASPEDVKLAKAQWAKAMGRRHKDGSKPTSVKAMEKVKSNAYKNKIVVEKDQHHMKSDDNFASKNGKGSAGVIKIDPAWEKPFKGDGVKANPEATLVHEVKHLYDANEGILDTAERISERNGVAVENEHRHIMGLDQRTKYGAWDVPQYVEGKEVAHEKTLDPEVISAHGFEWIGSSKGVKKFRDKNDKVYTEDQAREMIRKKTEKTDE